jgi:2,3-dihydroxybenzoate-AMP ligase
MAATLEGMVPWPEPSAQLYRARGYWKGVAIGQVFDAAVRRHAEREAVIDGIRRVTYRELGRMVERFATHLALREISSGCRVIFQLPNSLECVVAYFACLKVGAIPVTCMPAHRHTEIEHLARITDAAAWLMPSEYRRFDYTSMADDLRGALPAMREIIVMTGRTGVAMTRFEDLMSDAAEERVGTSALAQLTPSQSMPAVFQLSGGSTGLPKVIPRAHDDYLYNSSMLSTLSGYDDDGVALIAIPIMHNFPLVGAVQPGLLNGAKIVLAEEAEPERVFDLIERERVTWICAVPAMVVNWLNHPRLARTDLSSLKSLAVGGSRLNPEPARRVLSEIGPVLTQVYGMAEGLCCTTRADDAQDVIVETQGRPISPADEFRVVDEADREVPAGQPGELLTRGPYTIRGYYKALEHNRGAFTPDGYYRTGDIVRLGPSGNFIVEGRRKDLINRGGEKISAEEIENLILTHPSVQNAAVVAMTDAIMGERACAYVMLRDGARLDFPELTEFLAAKRIARFKLPERLEVIDQLPMTAVGKISKKDLRDDINRKLARERGAG